MGSEGRRVAPKPAIRPRVGGLIREVILENFMSYEYARVPLKPGLNIISGPNGAGKSSILLGISVALGQAYTERSRRLSDLIRRGKDVARVTLIFDNTPKRGRRPVPFSKSDTFMLSRYLKRDGSYWFEADYREISKGEVVRLLKGMGLNPDNLLIIMHQGMIEEFIVKSPQDKLRMVEEAVGFREYREALLSAQAQLEATLGEEATLQQLLESAEQSLEYWREIYDRFLKRRELLERKQELERELLWARIGRVKGSLERLREREEGRKAALENLTRRLERVREDRSKAREELARLKTQLAKGYFTLVRLERERAEATARVSALEEIGQAIEESWEPLDDLALKLTTDDELFRHLDAKAKEAYGRMLLESLERLKFRVKEARQRLEDLERRIRDLNSEVGGVEREIGRVNERFDKALERYVELSVDEALLEYRRKSIESELKQIAREKGELEGQLQALLEEAREAGPSVVTERSPTEVQDELKVVSAHLQSLGDVPEEAERIYTTYSDAYEEVKRRLEDVVRNKEALRREVEERYRVWREAVTTLLRDVDEVYRSILGQVGGVGSVRLVGGDDVAEAGLELTVGFRGAEAVVLDAYTQSGGERSVAVVAFLLALQEKVVSPFRAIDEFDIHLDPRNREALFKMILAYLKGKGDVQYVVITPSQLTLLEGDIHLLFVQNSYGRSRVSTVAQR